MGFFGPSASFFGSVGGTALAAAAAKSVTARSSRYVTRTSAEREGKGSHRHDECYVGEVVGAEDGGCVRPKSRVRGISG